MSSLENAFRTFGRENFVPDNLVEEVGIDIALPIGFGQTISQPTTVQHMLNWLEVEPGNRILDVGSGSGWTTALLAYLTGSRGQVFAVERIKELKEFGQQNCRRCGIKNASFHLAGQKLGLPRHGPYDRILVSASSQKLPDELLAQLKIGGKMVVPVGNDILEIEKLSDGRQEINTHSGYIFVPLIVPKTKG